MESKLATIFGHLPTHNDLPCEDGEPVENDFQTWQTILLLDSIQSHMLALHPDGRFLTAADMGIYYQITDPPLRGCKAPDWFYVPNVSRQADDGTPRRSYVMWHELVRPAVVVEYVSDQTRGQEHDRTPRRGKFWVYEQVLAIPYYIIYEPFKVQLEVYRLVDGEYELMRPDDRGFYFIKPLRLNIGLHYDSYGGHTLNWLRWFTENGDLLESNQEQLADEREQRKVAVLRANRSELLAEQEKQHAEQEKQRADQEKQRADQLAAKLRELGIDPESV